MFNKLKSCVGKSLPLRAQALPGGGADPGDDDDVPDPDDDTRVCPHTHHTCNPPQV